ncbi:conserved hypothetical protein [Rubrivivax sp. A210]|uniref:type I-G CRISPR-associated protein, Cas3-extension family n=1 Tax=Rubrivivax sp. A210 TaxID=2772301 RepID=UPI00191AB6DA|nr:hypothetical protein [Rubrivivax sp. A210]CAD5374843.1 conserved hypothetical protein [Rubrivivax sp. A210]
MASTNSVDLTGLVGSSPIGFMAALGLLRVCVQDHGVDLRLNWEQGHARLHGLGREELFDLLKRHMKGRAAAPEFNFTVAGDKGSRGKAMHLRTILPEDYRTAVAACQGDARALGFLAGFATDAVVNDKGFIARTKFDFSSGQQRLVDEFRSLAAMLDPEAKRPRVPFAARVERALMGGAYEEQHTFGWDPASLMTHAHQASAPTDSATPGQPFTVWLAVESLPLHAVLPTGPRRARTTGFAGTSAYVWPIWAEPLSLREVMLLRQRPVETLDRLGGVTEIWSSQVISVGKYGFLAPAARTASAGVAGGGSR